MAAEAGPMTETATTTKKKKKSLFGRLKKSGKKSNSRKESRNVEAEMAEYNEAMAAKSVARDGRPVITSYNAHQFHPSDVRDEDLPPTSPPTPATPDRSGARGYTSNGSPSSRGTGSPGSRGSPSSKAKRRGMRETVVLDRPPTAKESAFSGPPRYDWVDVETAAAVKVQSAFRRNQAMADVEARGGSTAAIRNRARAKARSANGKGNGEGFHSEDTPDMLACCGVGFMFGDATEEQNQEKLAEERRKEYQEAKRRQEEEEAKKRRFRFRKKSSNHYDEEFEVLDN